MKVITVLKKNKLLVFVALAYVLVFIFMPDKASESLKNSTYYLIEMAQVLPPIFLLSVVIEALVPKEMIMRSFGKKSGIKDRSLRCSSAVFLPAQFTRHFQLARHY